MFGLAGGAARFLLRWSLALARIYGKLNK
jgi:hypothetical protein